MMSSLTKVGQTLQNKLESSHDTGPLGRITKEGRSNLPRSFTYKSTNYKELWRILEKCLISTPTSAQEPEA